MDVVSFPTTTSPVRPDPTPPITARPSSGVSCLHDRMEIGGLMLDVCPQSSETHWLDAAGDELDPAIALARLFGSFDLIAALEGIGSPGPTILVYKPDSRRGRVSMRTLPLRRWIEAAPSLWITQDGERLLMAPTDQTLAANLARDL